MKPLHEMTEREQEELMERIANKVSTHFGTGYAQAGDLAGEFVAGLLEEQAKLLNRPRDEIIKDLLEICEDGITQEDLEEDQGMFMFVLTSWLGGLREDTVKRIMDEFGLEEQEADFFLVIVADQLEQRLDEEMAAMEEAKGKTLQ